VPQHPYVEIEGKRVCVDCRDEWSATHECNCAGCSLKPFQPMIVGPDGKAYHQACYPKRRFWGA
jgi:hypothetical protein